MKKFCAFVIILLLCIVNNCLTQPYANDYPYQKYAYNRESSQADADGTRYMKNNLRDKGGLLKSNSDTGLSYNLDSNINKQDLEQTKRGSTTDKLTHVQGEDFETDKTHKRKHIKSGFQNSYHKDENGSRSSFYEDSDDTGGKTVYDKRHGTRGDQQDQVYTEGLKNGVSRDKYDDRRTGYDNRDLQDRHQSYIDDQGKQHGYVDNYQAGLDDRYEIVRRPYSDLHHNQYFPLPRLPPPRLPTRRLDDDFDRPSRLPIRRVDDDFDRPSRLPIRRVDDDFDRYNANKHWGYDNRLPPPPISHHDSIAAPNQDFQTKRRITIFEDPRDELIDPKVDRFRDNGNYMTRSEVTRRFDYGPASDRAPLRLRYRGL